MHKASVKALTGNIQFSYIIKVVTVTAVGLLFTRYEGWEVVEPGYFQCVA